MVRGTVFAFFLLLAGCSAIISCNNCTREEYKELGKVILSRMVLISANIYALEEHAQDNGGHVVVEALTTAFSLAELQAYDDELTSACAPLVQRTAEQALINVQEKVSDYQVGVALKRCHETMDWLCGERPVLCTEGVIDTAPRISSPGATFFIRSNEDIRVPTGVCLSAHQYAQAL